MLKKLKSYVDRFNALDGEGLSQAVPNRDACDFLARQIPLLDCPDADLEETYYFRWWTFRKHFRETPFGHIITEFLPDVPWSGPHNSIVCPLGFHLREGRWLADPDGWVKECIRFWLGGHGDIMVYSSWPAAAVEEYCLQRGDTAFMAECLDPLTGIYQQRESLSMRKCGLCWSNDDRDGMEYSISGPGLRPTLNAYLYGDAMAISRMAAVCGREELSDRFAQKAARLKEGVQALLWDGEMYKTIPCGPDDPADFSSRPAVAPAHDARELVGFVPWYFRLPDPGQEGCFAHLTDPKYFLAPAGLTTAERSHPRYLEKHRHECLWNGPVWPYTTSQTLVAAANLLRDYPAQNAFTAEDYRQLLFSYAKAHRRILDDGRTVPWIDENIDPGTGRWRSRDILESWGWLPEKGGRERGRDYNHSLFCDLVLSGLLGIRPDGRGGLTANPMIPPEWEWFCVTGLVYGGKSYTVRYDRNGSRYGKGSGLQIVCGT